MVRVEIPPSLSFKKLEPGDSLSNFDCGRKDNNDFLKDDALEYQRSNLAVTCFSGQVGAGCGFC